MANITSRWRLNSREVIAKTLATLPADATREQKQKALRDAYPFGERRYLPYKMWLKEVREALKEKRVRPVDRVYFGRAGKYATSNKPSSGGLIVECDWCRIAWGRGCLVCFHARHELADRGPGWEKHFGPWLDQMRASPSDLTLALTFADMIEEHGFGVMADHYRRWVALVEKRILPERGVEPVDGPVATGEPHTALSAGTGRLTESNRRGGSATSPQR